MTDPIELIHFNFSHFNEKARWALDYKGVEHKRTSLLPGPHMMTTRRMTGQTATPILRIGERIITGSAEIIDALEQQFPEPPLYPANPDTRAAALDVQKYFDDIVGPAVRIGTFVGMIDDGRYTTNLFSHDKPWLTRALYLATFPIARGMIKRGNGITGQDAIDNAYRVTAEAFDRVARDTEATGYLAGDTFTVADLAAAALLAPAVDPPNSPMERPKPMPDGLEAFLERWRNHPGRDWVVRMFNQHR